MLGAVLTLSVAGAVYGAVGLEPGEPPQPVAAAPMGAPGTAPIAEHSWVDAAPGGSADSGLADAVIALVLGAMASVASSLADDRARRDRLLATLPKAPDDMIVVLVPGYGAGYGTQFEHLIAALGLTDDRVEHFDYRWPSDHVNHVHATEAAEIGGVSGALEAFIAGLSRSGTPIYLIGHSKGAAAIANLVADWDAHGGRASEAVVGAALLDPPLERSVTGLAQSLGGLIPFIPNDGGYAPVRCDGGCRDTRAHLGEASGVEVTVFRNPGASVANFTGHPPGLRVFDIDDGRPAPAPYDVAGVSRAHRFALHSAAVASCVAAEMWAPGRCRFDEHDTRSLALEVGK